MNGLRRYVTESIAELKKVTWPTRQDVVRLTLIVLAVSIVIGIYIALLDFGFRSAVDQVL
ncbi:MAG: preprotein translocase subunit SecE [Chloroflexota bacterium]